MKIIIKSVLITTLTIPAILIIQHNKTNIISIETVALSISKIAKGNFKYNNPPIPTGFKAINTSDAKWIKENNYVRDWNEGLVIKDENGNEFTWVPANKENYKKWTTININYNDNELKDDKLPKGVTSEQEQIIKYGGFYVGRYETTIPEKMVDLIQNIDEVIRNTKGIPNIQKEGIPWTNLNYIYAKINAESMYQTEDVKSGLITGTQWDTIMRWFNKENINVLTDSTSWGNYRQTLINNIQTYSPDFGKTWFESTTKNIDESWMLKTGVNEYTKIKNIYDISGNTWEWTNEIYKKNLGVIRGGNCCWLTNDFPAAYRHALDINEPAIGTSSRIVLYIK